MVALRSTRIREACLWSWTNAWRAIAQDVHARRLRVPFTVSSVPSVLLYAHRSPGTRPGAGNGWRSGRTARSQHKGRSPPSWMGMGDMFRTCSVSSSSSASLYVAGRRGSPARVAGGVSKRRCFRYNRSCDVPRYIPMGVECCPTNVVVFPSEPDRATCRSHPETTSSIRRAHSSSTMSRPRLEISSTRFEVISSRSIAACSCRWIF